MPCKQQIYMYYYSNCNHWHEPISKFLDGLLQQHSYILYYSIHNHLREPTLIHLNGHFWQPNCMYRNSNRIHYFWPILSTSMYPFWQHHYMYNYPIHNHFHEPILILNRCPLEAAFSQVDAVQSTLLLFVLLNALREFEDSLRGHVSLKESLGITVSLLLSPFQYF